MPFQDEWDLPYAVEAAFAFTNAPHRTRLNHRVFAYGRIDVRDGLGTARYSWAVPARPRSWNRSAWINRSDSASSRLTACARQTCAAPSAASRPTVRAWVAMTPHPLTVAVASRRMASRRTSASSFTAAASARSMRSMVMDDDVLKRMVGDVYVGRQRIVAVMVTGRAG